MGEIAVTVAREQLGDLVNRAEYRDERFVLTRHGHAVAALVPIEVLRDLEAAEDAADLEAARRASAETEAPISHAEVLTELAADEARPA